MNKKGFTLLELIIVIVIIGVLASLALPRLFFVVEKARAAEAINMIGSLRRAIERCALMRDNDYSDCWTDGKGIGVGYWRLATFEDPGDFPGSKFRYQVKTTVSSYNICALRFAPSKLPGGVACYFLCMGQGFIFPVFTATSGSCSNPHIGGTWVDDDVIRWAIPEQFESFVP